MAEISKKKATLCTTRQSCQKLLKEHHTDVYVPRSKEVWKTVKNPTYHCVMAKGRCTQAYLSGKNDYGKALTPFIFWDEQHQQNFRKKYNENRYLSEHEGERHYQLIRKMSCYYHRLKKEGRF